MSLDEVRLGLQRLGNVVLAHGSVFYIMIHVFVMAIRFIVYSLWSLFASLVYSRRLRVIRNTIFTFAIDMNFFDIFLSDFFGRNKAYFGTPFITNT